MPELQQTSNLLPLLPLNFLVEHQKDWPMSTKKALQIRVWGVHESRHLLQDHAGESEELLIMAQIKTEDQRILFFHEILDFLTMKIRTYSGHITIYIYPIFIKISIKIRTSEFVSCHPTENSVGESQGPPETP